MRKVIFSLLAGVCLLSISGCELLDLYLSTTTTVTTIASPVIVQMVNVEGGTFQMGDDFLYTSLPIHTVTVSGFQIGKLEITQGQYREVMGSNPSYFTDGPYPDSRPVDQVKWYEAVAFCNQLSLLHGYECCYQIDDTLVTLDVSKNGYRLPSEAEWEFAAKGGTLTHGYTYAGSNSPDFVGWYNANSGQVSHVVGAKAANELGIYDMSGNLREWCFDLWTDSYPSEVQVDPMGPSTGEYRVRRGGAWDFSENMLRCTARNYGTPENRRNFTGFRVVRRP